MTNLWIDDLRDPPEGWEWAKTSEEAIAVLARHLFGDGSEVIDEISFDHDLGGDDTTRKVVLWMCEMDYFPGAHYIHSANPVGREWLEGMLDKYGNGVLR